LVIAMKPETSLTVTTASGISGLTIWREDWNSARVRITRSPWKVFTNVITIIPFHSWIAYPWPAREGIMAYTGPGRSAQLFTSRGSGHCFTHCGYHCRILTRLTKALW
jgi:hypothetical protein